MGEGSMRNTYSSCEVRSNEGRLCYHTLPYEITEVSLPILDICGGIETISRASLLQKQCLN